VVKYFAINIDPRGALWAGQVVGAGVLAEYISKRNPNMPPMHPGELVTEIADTIGIFREHLDAIMSKRRPVAPEVATRLGKAFGNGRELWIVLQAACDASIAAR
jgi:addiction module HigA family antidote